MGRSVLALVAGTAFLLGCATTSDWSPMIDTKGVDSAAYEADLAECTVLAEANPDTAKEDSTKKGAMEGGKKTAALAGVGAVTAVVVTGGMALVPAVVGAGAVGGGFGAVAGAQKGSEMADLAKQGTIRNCLAGRGYSVVN